jgi:hypothetical protein
VWICTSALLYILLEQTKTPWSHKWTIPAKLPPLVGEVSVSILQIEGVVWSAHRIPTAVNFGFLDRSCYFLEIAPQLSSQGWVIPVPDPLLLRKSGSSGNQTRDLWICSQELWPLDHSSSHILLEWCVIKHRVNCYIFRLVELRDLLVCRGIQLIILLDLCNGFHGTPWASSGSSFQESSKILAVHHSTSWHPS